MSLDLERFVTQVAAQIALEFVGHGGAGSVESSSQDGSAASAASSSPVADPDLDRGVRLRVQALHFPPIASLVQQMLDALNESHLEPRKIQEYLPSLFARLRGEVGEELRDERDRKNAQPKEQVDETPTSLSMNAAVAIAY